MATGQTGPHSPLGHVGQSVGPGRRSRWQAANRPGRPNDCTGRDPVSDYRLGVVIGAASRPNSAQAEF